ncbi:MAG: hypothetical protein FK734_09070 [Asgard group archaeon]|nr:hypothetical protein [Asgard group archaeon]
MRKIGRVIFILSTIILFVSPLLMKTTQIVSQANLIEEEDYFKIFSGQFYNLIIPKANGPEMFFEINDQCSVNLVMNYISEYNSPTIYLNSLDYLAGKGYALNEIDWDIYGLSETSRTYVNFSRNYLDQDTAFDFSANIVSQNQTINGYDVTALKDTYLQMNINNWSYSEEMKGLAFNIIAEFSEPTNYDRLGPYAISETQEFVIELFCGSYIFEMRFRQIIDLIKTNGDKIGVYSNVYAKFNVQLRDNTPADFWISIPYVDNIEQIILGFDCTININPTSLSSLNSILVIVIGFSFISFSTRIIIKRCVRKRN